MQSIFELLEIDAENIRAYGSETKYLWESMAEIKTCCDTRAFVKLNKKNDRNESLEIEITETENDGSKHSLAEAWFKEGYTQERLSSHITIDCYITDERGHCFDTDQVNPTIKIKKFTDERGPYYRNVINFDWMLEATPDNAKRLLREIVYRFYSRK